MNRVGALLNTAACRLGQRDPTENPGPHICTAGLSSLVLNCPSRAVQHLHYSISVLFIQQMVRFDLRASAQLDVLANGVPWFESESVFVLRHEGVHKCS